eukprot:9586828-Heterocapsa_arctica.AAC.1
MTPSMPTLVAHAKGTQVPLAKRTSGILRSGQLSHKSVFMSCSKKEVVVLANELDAVASLRQDRLLGVLFEFDVAGPILIDTEAVKVKAQ